MIIPGIVEIGADEVGIIRKKIGAHLPPGCHIALRGEAGFQVDVLSPGTHFGYFSLFYEVYKVKAINIPQGEIGLVVARDGMPIPQHRSLGKVVECHDFQDARAFLENGGEKGRQLGILTSGIYQINTELFTVITSANATHHGMKPEDLQVCSIGSDKIGIVTTYDGTPLQPGEIAGSVIVGHNNFQNGQNFIEKGGYRGLQEELLPSGVWSLNPWFVSVEQIPLTIIPSGSAGVVISSVGKTPSEDNANLVDPGYRGIWKTPLFPGQHQINYRVMDVEIVSTHEIALSWSNQDKPLTNYDANLHALELRSKDGFVFNIEVTQVIRIPGENAPKMISRMGSPSVELPKLIDANEIAFSKRKAIRSLVARVLEPLISSYFRVLAQNYDVLDFFSRRRELQEEAMAHIESALEVYGVQAVGTFLNEIDLPSELESILKKRKIVMEERKFYEEEIKAETQRRELLRNKDILKIEKELAILKDQADTTSIEVENHSYGRHENSEVSLLFIRQFLLQAGARIQLQTLETKQENKSSFICVSSIQGTLKNYTPIPVLLIEKPTEKDVLDIILLQKPLSNETNNLKLTSQKQVGVIVYTEPPEDAIFWIKMTEVRLRNNFILVPIPFAAIQQALVEDKDSVLLSTASRALLTEFADLYLPGADLFDDRNAIGDTLTFFGRNELVHRLGEELRRNQGVGLFGLRKSGKTSVLIQLSYLMRKHPIIYVDLQPYGGKLFYGAELFNRILKRLFELVKEKTSNFNLTLQKFELNSPATKITTDFAEQVCNFSRALGEAGYETPILILLDEVERVLPTEVDSHERVEEFNAFFGVLRALSQEQRQISLLVADVHPDCNRINHWKQANVPTNPVFSFFKEIFLFPFPESETVRMIENIGSLMEVSFDNKTLTSIHEKSGGHPFLARQLASLLHKELAIGGNKEIEWSLAQKYFDKPFSYSRFLKDYIGYSIWDDLQKRGFASAISVLNLIACNEELSSSISEQLIFQRLSDSFTEIECLDALLWLEKAGLVCKKEAGGSSSYLMQVPLLSLWIRMHMKENEIRYWKIL